MELNTTIDNIQLKSNMLTSVDNEAANWLTDERYPSAKAVTELVTNTTNAIIEACENTSGQVEYPVGSIIITSTNTNPGTSVSGTWELYDKEYKNSNDPLTLNAGDNAWTPVSAKLNPGSGAASAGGYITRDGHATRIRLKLITTVALSATTPSEQLKLGIISPTRAGASTNIPQLGVSVSDLMTMLTTQAVDPDGIKTYDIQYKIDPDGSVTITKIFNSASLPIGTTIDITNYIPMIKDFMADSACDKFYWKRTK